MAADGQQTGGSPFSGVPANSVANQPPITHTAIIWLAVLGAILLVTIILIAVLLCRCTCRRSKGKRRSRGTSVVDGRNEFHAWNRNVPPVSDHWGGGYTNSVAPPTATTVKPAGHIGGPYGDAHPGEPVIVDEVEPRKNSSRYYSGWSRLSRLSHIGRAY